MITFTRFHLYILGFVLVALTASRAEADFVFIHTDLEIAPEGDRDKTLVVWTIDPTKIEGGIHSLHFEWRKDFEGDDPVRVALGDPDSGWKPTATNDYEGGPFDFAIDDGKQNATQVFFFKFYYLSKRVSQSLSSIPMSISYDKKKNGTFTTIDKPYPPTANTYGLSVRAIPEPASVGLLSAGLLGALHLVRRRR